MKLKKFLSFDKKIDKNIPIEQQLNKFKKSCFQPEKSNSELIKYNCEDCNFKGTYNYCDFYELTHKEEFKDSLRAIKQDSSILNPNTIHPQLKRYCRNFIPLESILDKEWKKYKNPKKKIKTACQDCNFKPYCPFFLNNFTTKFLSGLIDEKKSTNKEVRMIFGTQINEIGYVINSKYFQDYVSKRTSNKTEFENNDLIDDPKKLEKYRYSHEKILNKVEKGIKIFPKDNITISNIHLNFLLRYDEKFCRNMMVYLLTKMYINYSRSEFNAIQLSKYNEEIGKEKFTLTLENIEEGLIVLNSLKIIHSESKNGYNFNTQLSYNLTTINSIIRENGTLAI